MSSSKKKHTKDDFQLPGYKKALIKFVPSTSGSGASEVSIRFAIDPQSIQEQRANNFQMDKTMGGWFVSRTGRSVSSMTLSGVIMDTKISPERLKFLEAYEKYCVDAQNNLREYFSNYYQVIEIEGIKYSGTIQNLSLSKSSQLHLIYQLTINFLFFKTEVVHQTANEGSLSGGLSKPDGFRPASSLAKVLATEDEGNYNTYQSKGSLPINEPDGNTVSRPTRRKRSGTPAAISTSLLSILLKKGE